MTKNYILRDMKLVEVGLMEWAVWMESHFTDRIVEKTTVGSVEISTVFLGIDHAFFGPPILFETMTFGLDEELMNRYSTYGDAKNGHFDMVKLVEELVDV